MQIENGCRWLHFVHSLSRKSRQNQTSLLSPSCNPSGGGSATAAASSFHLILDIFFVFAATRAPAGCMLSHPLASRQLLRTPLSFGLSHHFLIISDPPNRCARRMRSFVCSSAFGICLRMVDGPLAPTSYSMRVVFWGSRGSPASELVPIAMAPQLHPSLDQRRRRRLPLAQTRPRSRLETSPAWRDTTPERTCYRTANPPDALYRLEEAVLLSDIAPGLVGQVYL